MFDKRDLGQQGLGSGKALVWFWVFLEFLDKGTMTIPRGVYQKPL